MKKLFTIIFLGLIAGCANQALLDWAETLPEPNADYGEYPNNYKDLMIGWFQDNLRDPDSAKYSDFTTPHKEYIIITQNNAPAVAYGYSACVSVNSKNGYGGYTGKQLYFFMFQNGQIIKSNNVKKGGSFLGFERFGNCNNGKAT